MRTVVGVATNAGYVLAVQLLALVTLDAADYGAFSLQYLLFAFGSSLSLSIISEAWLRSELETGIRSSWRDYGNIALFLAVAVGIVALVVSVVVPTLRDVAVLGAVGAAASVYRASARYYGVRVGGAVVLADMASLVVTVSVWAGFVLFNGDRGLFGMVTAWAGGATASALASRWPPMPSLLALRRWLREKWKYVAVLLRDSLLMDAGAIGTPYVLAPLLGVAEFGIYRAVSNVAAPVRLVITPLRPRISLLTTAAPSWKRDAGVVAVAVAFGALAYAGLLAVRLSPVNLGALADLVEFAVPAAVFVGANFIGTFYYIMARAGLGSSALLYGRVFQTVVAVVGPVLGFVFGGLSGAIWGYAIVTVLSALVWMGLVRGSARKR